MREDMYKVIVERPRRAKEGDAIAARLRKDFDWPVRLGMRAGYGSRSLNTFATSSRSMSALAKGGWLTWRLGGDFSGATPE
jgi:hypothetical protein